MVISGSLTWPDFFVLTTEPLYTEQRKDKKARLKMTEAFISKLRQQNDMVTEFDEHLWTTLLDFVTVYTDKDVRFTFKDGTEIQV